jgi:hypothetical protein
MRSFAQGEWDALRDEDFVAEVFDRIVDYDLREVGGEE